MNGKIVAGIVVGVGVGAAALFIFHKVRSKKNPAEASLESTKQEVIERIKAHRAQRATAEEPEIHSDIIWNPEADYENYKRCGEEKPTLDEVFGEISGTETKEEPMEPQHEEPEGWEPQFLNTTPVFSEEDWASEKGTIFVVDKDEALGDIPPEYDTDLGIWFPDPGVFVNEDLEPMDIVDTVGPSAFMELMTNPGKAVFCRNDEFHVYFELMVNNTPFDEAKRELYEPLPEEGYDDGLEADEEE